MNIVVQDQLPKANDERIRVLLQTPDMATVNHVEQDRNTNNLRWTFTIPAGAQVRIPYRYCLQWPKGRALKKTAYV